MISLRVNSRAVWMRASCSSVRLRSSAIAGHSSSLLGLAVHGVLRILPGAVRSPVLYAVQAAADRKARRRHDVLASALYMSERFGSWQFDGLVAVGGLGE